MNEALPNADETLAGDPLDPDEPLNAERVRRLPPPGAMPPSKHSPGSLFAAEHQQKWAAIIALVAVLVFAVLAQCYTVSRLTQTRLVFAVDGANTVHAGPLETLSPESSVIRISTILATEAAFQRSVTFLNGSTTDTSGADFDLPELVAGLFRADARKLLEADLHKVAPDIALRHLSQKVEIAEVLGLSQKAGNILVRVKGDLKRSGGFAGQPISESVPLTALFAFRENPRLDQRGQYPFIVVDFAAILGAARQDAAPAPAPAPAAPASALDPGAFPSP